MIYKDRSEVDYDIKRERMLEIFASESPTAVTDDTVGAIAEKLQGPYAERTVFCADAPTTEPPVLVAIGVLMVSSRVDALAAALHNSKISAAEAAACVGCPLRPICPDAC